MASGITYGRIPANAVHLCVDMQRLFAEETAWRTPWMPRVLPVVVRLCERRADRTCFTRFMRLRTGNTDRLSRGTLPPCSPRRRRRPCRLARRGRRHRL